MRRNYTGYKRAGAGRRKGESLICPVLLTPAAAATEHAVVPSWLLWSSGKELRLPQQRLLGEGETILFPFLSQHPGLGLFSSAATYATIGKACMRCVKWRLHRLRSWPSMHLNSFSVVKQERQVKG